MHHPSITGEKVYLRCMEESDVEGPYLDWLNDEEVTRYLTGVRRSPATTEYLLDYIQSMARSDEDILFAIHDVESKEFIGTSHFGPIDWRNRTAVFGIMVGNRRYWGKGYGTEAITLVLHYAFRILELHKVTAGIAAIHQPSITAFKKAGFGIEGEVKSQFLVDGEYCDWLYMGVTRDDFLRDTKIDSNFRKH